MGRYPPQKNGGYRPFYMLKRCLKKMQNTTDMLNNERRCVINAELIDVLTFFD